MKPLSNSGRILASAGKFEAYWLLPKVLSDGSPNPGSHYACPSYAVRFRLTADPALLFMLRDLAFTVESQLNIPMDVWTRKDGVRAGFSIHRVDEVPRLCEALRTGAARANHPRLPVLDAWEQCVYWSTYSIRARQRDMIEDAVRELDKRGQTKYTAKAAELVLKDLKRWRYRPSDYAEKRTEAIKALNSANRAFPPEPLDPKESYYDYKEAE